LVLYWYSTEQQYPENEVFMFRVLYKLLFLWCFLGITLSWSGYAISEETSNEGFIELQLSSPNVFIGGMLTITGVSGNVGNLNQVDLTITGEGSSETYIAHLDQTGTFAVRWFANGKPGKYQVVAWSSDKKSSKKADFTVELDEMTSDNIEINKKLLNTLKQHTDQARLSLTPEDATETNDQLEKITKKIEQIEKIFLKINEAGAQLSKAIHAGGLLSENTAINISQLNEALQEHVSNTQKLLDNINHKTGEYTICDTLVMVNETCAAFSTATNFLGKFGQVADNITIDKIVPTTAAKINSLLPVKSGTKSLTADEDVAFAAKALAAAAKDGKGIFEGTGPLGIAGDLTQLYAGKFMKTYCNSIEGKINHDYKVDIRNKNRETWWKYGYTTEAVLTLHYPKTNNVGKIVQMKGHIEGNATHFDFYQNMAIEDEFIEKSKGRVIMHSIHVRRPESAPFASSAVDKAGFGMMARALATPSYFNLPVDATYDKNAGTIRLFMTDGGIDFSPLVKNRVLFIAPVPLPLFHVEDFPINKAKDTINAVIKRYGEYKVVTGSDDSLSFSGKGTHHMGDPSSEMETTVHLNVEAKQQ
jgi:hypothetical protein